MKNQWKCKVRSHERLLEDAEKRRTEERGYILFWKRNEQFLNVHDYLYKAETDPLELEKLLSIPVVAAEISNTCFEYAGACKIKYITHNLEDPPIGSLVDRGVVPHLLRCVGEDKGTGLQFEAVSALNGILKYGSAEHAQIVMAEGGASCFVSLIVNSEDNKVKKQALLAIKHCTQLSTQYRDVFLDEDVVTHLATFAGQLMEPTMIHDHGALLLKETTFTLLSLCSGDPNPAFNKVEGALPTLRRMLHDVPTTFQFADVYVNALHALFNLTRGSTQQVEAAITPELCQRLVALLPTGLSAIVHAICPILQRVLSRDEPTSQVLIDSGMLPPLWQLLNSQDELDETKRRVCKMILDGNFLWPLLQILQADLWSHELKLDAVSLLSSAAKLGSPQQIENLVNQSCLQPICNYLIHGRTRIICCQGLNSISRAGNRNLINGVNVLLPWFMVSEDLTLWRF